MCISISLWLRKRFVQENKAAPKDTSMCGLSGTMRLLGGEPALSAAAKGG